MLEDKIEKKKLQKEEIKQASPRENSSFGLNPKAQHLKN
jgi:hypothetical protein